MRKLKQIARQVKCKAPNPFLKMKLVTSSDFVVLSQGGKLDSQSLSQHLLQVPSISADNQGLEILGGEPDVNPQNGSSLAGGHHANSIAIGRWEDPNLVIK